MSNLLVDTGISQETVPDLREADKTMDMDLDSILDGPPASTKEPGRLRRSCELCRASKGRCHPSTEINRCQKCLKEGKECVFLEVKLRPKRGKNSRTRVAEMEQKLESLYTLLQERKQATNKTMPPPMIGQAEVLPEFSFEATPPYHSTPSRNSYRKISQQFPIFSLPFLVFDEFRDVISKGIVSFDQAEECLDFFRGKSSNFPFVHVSPQTSLDTLRREKPFLLHSILSIASQLNLKLQERLELELLEILSKKVFIEGEKSLDIIQGILVYISWYHLYFNPGRQQIYQLSQMAATMAIGLRLNCRLHSAKLTNNFSLINSTAPGQQLDDVERLRTFLGCYYVASSVSIGLRKPSILSYSDHIEDCSQVLVNAGDAEADCLIPYFIRLQHFAEDVNHAFDYETILHFHQQLDSVRVEILSKSFRQQLDEMRMLFPSEIWNNATISMAYYTNTVYLNEVGFHANISSSPDMMSSHLTARSWYHSSSRHDSLIACLQAAKEYLEYLLLLPSHDLLSFTIHEFVHLIYIILVLARFASGCDCPPIESHLRKSANLEDYLTRMIAMTEPLISFSDGEKRTDYVFHLQRLFRASKAWLDHISSGQSLAGGAPQLTFMNIFPAVRDASLELSTTLFGFENNDITLSLAEWPTCSSVDPSLVMIGGSVV